MFDEIAKGLSPDRKAKAALFLSTFRHRADHVMLRRGPGAFGPRAGGGGMELDGVRAVRPLPPAPPLEPHALTRGEPAEELEIELDDELEN